MADDTGNNSESGENIMEVAAQLKAAAPKRVAVTFRAKGTGGIGGAFAAAAAPPPAPKPPAAAAKPRLAPAPRPSSAAAAKAAIESYSELMPMLSARPSAAAAAMAPAPEEEAAAAAAPAVAVAASEEVAAAAAATTAMKVRLKPKARASAVVTHAPPADAEKYAVKEIFKSPGVDPVTNEKIPSNAAVLQTLITARPMEIDPAASVFRPISASSFNNFMIETFRQYSPMLMAYDLKRAELFGEARSAGAPISLEEASRQAEAIVRAPKPLDKDACKKNDPNKVENFYYQKLVRDYLSRDTPYRGLLVYHGLGSGKTCTSIAAAEALYWGGMKTIYILTPATLSNNYRRELGKCGYFPLRANNYWKFLEVPDVNKPGPEFIWLQNILGLSPTTIQKQGGGWVPKPPTAQLPSNWTELSDPQKESIREQQREHLAHRFKFIHYNGVVPLILAQLAASGVREGKSPFDDAVVIIDEIHNLVRTVNGTQIGGKPISKIMSGRTVAAGGAGRASGSAVDAVEPHDFTWTMPLWRENPGYRYPRGYTLYRLLQNAVGSKVIALSATPMINYAQEIAVLLNMIGGEQRMVSIGLDTLSRDPAVTRSLTEWAQQRPDVDFYAIEQEGRSLFLNLTPVPYGFAKVIGENYATRGFVRLPKAKIVPVENSIERNMDLWAVSLVKDLEEKGLLGAGRVAEDEATVAAHRDLLAQSIEGRSSAKVPALATKTFALKTLPLLPDDAEEFVNTFINKATLEIQLPELLKARASGLVSYYRGGSEELMPRTTRNEVIEVPLSDYAFGEYTKARLAELEMEGGAPAEEGGAGGGKKAKGMTRQEMDMYTQATKTQQAGFLALSRAACNWVFPESVERPMGSLKDQAKLLGLDQDRTIAADLAVDVDADMEEGAAAAKKAKGRKANGSAAAGAGGAGAGPEEGAEATEAVLPDEEAAAPTVAPRADAATLSVIGRLMAALEADGGKFLNAELEKYSPKYATILANIRRSPGPVLVYSQFKTLEGLGIFAAVLRAAEEGYVQLDIIWDSAANEWVIPAELMTPEMIARPRYILYTGDQELDKRRLLLQLYNADRAGLPPRLAAQCGELLRGDPDNRNGKVCQIFMITQSGAEGISMFNTRQVHIMEPYWNNVRIQQVVGRAIRLCSHMNLDWDERTVEVFTYLTVFSAEQKTGGAKGSRQLMMADKGMTTDQMIFDIATKKQKLADGLMEIAQSAAVDCTLHSFEHGKTVNCFRYEPGSRPMFMYHPDWQKDKAEIEAKRYTRAVGAAGAVARDGGGGR